LLEGYWPQFLASSVPLTQSPVPLAQRPRPVKDPPPPPPKKTGMLDQLRGSLPRLPFF
jgi:hypothetical protein